jgi:hypothetical protein
MGFHMLENVSSEVMRHGILFDGRASPGFSLLLVRPSVRLFVRTYVLARPTAFFTLLILFG